METIYLGSGAEMPIIGTGTNTYGKEKNKYDGAITGDTTELDQAIAAGYRHIDTAISYRNESVVGDAVVKSGLPRDAFFLTSKIPGRPEHVGTDEAVHNSVRASLNALRTDYIDLY
ncbi:aldo/keto reductase, partial [Jeotgalibaca porci]|uniref:aldo/keto reductase n=1 Tax=Jeotgalibaca porci TaxID=1868793 RepID=UPI00359FE9AD